MAGRLLSLEHPFLRRHRTNWDDYTWGDMDNPGRIFDQHFGMGLQDRDLLPPTLWRGMYLRPRVKELVPQQTGVSEVENKDKDFKVNLDVTHFKPEEVTVKTVENRVVVHCKHDEREDEHGFIQREFKRTYVLPRDVDPLNIRSSLTADGVLSLTAPKKSKDGTSERMIPVEHVPTIPQCGPE